MFISHVHKNCNTFLSESHSWNMYSPDFTTGTVTCFWCGSNPHQKKPIPACSVFGHHMQRNCNTFLGKNHRENLHSQKCALELCAFFWYRVNRSKTQVLPVVCLPPCAMNSITFLSKNHRWLCITKNSLLYSWLLLILVNQVRKCQVCSAANVQRIGTHSWEFKPKYGIPKILMVILQTSSDVG